MNKKDEIQKLIWKIIAKLNDSEPSALGGLFDCGELGFVLIYWERHGWAFTVYEKESIYTAEEFLKEK